MIEFPFRRIIPGWPPHRQPPAVLLVIQMRQVLADLDAVLKWIGDGAAVDAEMSCRIEDRAERNHHIAISAARDGFSGTQLRNIETKEIK